MQDRRESHWIHMENKQDEERAQKRKSERRNGVRI